MDVMYIQHLGTQSSHNNNRENKRPNICLVAHNGNALVFECLCKKVFVAVSHCTQILRSFSTYFLPCGSTAQTATELKFQAAGISRLTILSP